MCETITFIINREKCTSKIYGNVWKTCLREEENIIFQKNAVIGKKRDRKRRGIFVEEMIPPPIEIHTWLQATALKIPSTKSPRKYTVIPFFTFLFGHVTSVRKRKKRDGKKSRRSETRLSFNISRQFLLFFEKSVGAPEFNTRFEFNLAEINSITDLTRRLIQSCAINRSSAAGDELIF